ncbi:MAG: hypothetical protein QXV17_01535 [Candidatus Micrarchaeaceae archaeon]
MNNHTISDLTNNIISYLGGPIVNVELTQDQINYAISESVRILSRYYPTQRYMTLPVPLGTYQINLEDPDGR